MRYEVIDYTDNGKCSNCGECCSNCLPLADIEIKRIKAYIKKYNIKEQRHNAFVGVDMTCPFRDEANKKCLIYEIRPAICRHFKCDHDMEDIKKQKMNFHKMNNIVFMRSEFFKNNEDVNCFSEVMRTILFGG